VGGLIREFLYAGAMLTLTRYSLNAELAVHELEDEEQDDIPTQEKFVFSFS